MKVEWLHQQAVSGDPQAASSVRDALASHPSAALRAWYSMDRAALGEHVEFLCERLLQTDDRALKLVYALALAHIGPGAAPVRSRLESAMPGPPKGPVGCAIVFARLCIAPQDEAAVRALVEPWLVPKPDLSAYCSLAFCPYLPALGELAFELIRNQIQSEGLSGFPWPFVSRIAHTQPALTLELFEPALESALQEASPLGAELLRTDATSVFAGVFRSAPSERSERVLAAACARLANTHRAHELRDIGFWMYAWMLSPRATPFVDRMAGLACRHFAEDPGPAVELMTALLRGMRHGHQNSELYKLLVDGVGPDHAVWLTSLRDMPEALEAIEGAWPLGSEWEPPPQQEWAYSPVSEAAITLLESGVFDG